MNMLKVHCSCCHGCLMLPIRIVHDWGWQAHKATKLLQAVQFTSSKPPGEDRRTIQLHCFFRIGITELHCVVASLTHQREIWVIRSCFVHFLAMVLGRIKDLHSTESNKSK